MTQLSNFPLHITIGEKYKPAMQLTDPVEAIAYFEKCVRHNMAWGKSRQEAESIERQNLGYFAGYYDNETRLRVERLFQCAHAIVGAIAKHGPPTTEEAFNMGVEMGNRMQP